MLPLTCSPDWILIREDGIKTTHVFIGSFKRLDCAICSKLTEIADNHVPKVGYEMPCEIPGPIFVQVSTQSDKA